MVSSIPTQQKMPKVTKIKSEIPLAISLVYCLDTEQGHILSYNKTFGEAVQRLGWEHTAAVRAAARVQTLPSGWTRSLGTQSNIFSNRIALKLEKEYQLVVTTARYLRQQIEQNDRPIILFMDWFNIVHLIALCCALCFVPNRDNLHLWLLYRWGFTDSLNEHAHQMIHALIKLFIKPSNITLFSESDAGAAAINQTFGQSVHVLPMPQIVLPDEPYVLPQWATSMERKDKIVCIWPGYPAEDKGLAVIKRFASLTGEAAKKFVLISDERAPFQEINGGCQIIPLPAGLPRAEYIGWLRTADFTFVPYDPRSYANRTSGVFADGLATGSIPVTMAGTWMADELRKFGLNDLILDWTSPVITEKLVAIKGSTHLLALVQQMQQSYALIHGMHGYAKTLQEIFQVEVNPK